MGECFRMSEIALNNDVYPFRKDLVARQRNSEIEKLILKPHTQTINPKRPTEKSTPEWRARPALIHK